MRASSPLVVALVIVAAACGTQEPAATSAQATDTPPPTTAPPTVPQPTTPPSTIAEGLPAAPWSVPPLPAEAAPSVLGEAWEAASNKDTCAALYPADANDLASDAVVRSAAFEGGWGIAWDRPEGPGRSEDGAYCEDCGRGAFGVAGSGGGSPGGVDAWPDQIEWSDGSRAGYGVEGLAEPSSDAPHLSSLALAGQGCSYNVWSYLGEDHLLQIIDELRFVEGMLAVVISDDEPAGIETLGPAPWLRAAVGDAAVPAPLLAEYTEEVIISATCPLLTPVSLGAGTEGARARRAENSGEMLAAWDLPDGPGRYGSGEYCADCGRGALGIGTLSRDIDAPLGFERFAVTHDWDDGSVLRIVNEGTEFFNVPPDRAEFTDPQSGAPAVAPYNGYLIIPGLGCGYRLWSFLGADHVVEIAQGLRPVLGFGDYMFSDGVCPSGSLRGDFDGDGIDEAFEPAPPRSLDGASSVIMCRSDGRAPAQVFISGTGELLSLADIDADGDVEILAGDTSVTAAFYEAYTEGEDGFPDVVITSDDGLPLTLIDGASGEDGYRWGCRDDRTLVQLKGSLRAGALDWVRTAYRIEGVVAVEVGEGTGSTPVTSSDLVDALFEGVIGDLVGTARCGG